MPWTLEHGHFRLQVRAPPGQSINVTQCKDTKRSDQRDLSHSTYKLQRQMEHRTKVSRWAFLPNYCDKSFFCLSIFSTASFNIRAFSSTAVSMAIRRHPLHSSDPTPVTFLNAVFYVHFRYMRTLSPSQREILLIHYHRS